MKQPGRKSPASLVAVPPEPPRVERCSAIAPAPAHLSDKAAAFWRETVVEYDLAPHHLLILQAACETLDRQQQARQALACHGGLTVTDPQGRLQQHPAVVVERNSTILLARLIREMDLDTSSEAFAFDRPPPIRSNRN